jgi:hypothetical protein
MVRYFAVISRSMGYALDYYPEERLCYIKDCSKNGLKILGAFNTPAAALRAINIWFMSGGNHERNS